MCNAWSGVVLPTRKVIWEFGVDSHEKIIKKHNLKDDKVGKFIRVEISPKNKDYLKPDEWVFKIDENAIPGWFKASHEKACWNAWKSWKAKLDEILVYKEVVHPFELKPPEITEEHIQLLREWDSVRGSIWGSVWDSVWDSVNGSVINSVWDSVNGSVINSVWDSVNGSVINSVWDSVNGSVINSVWDSVINSVWDSVDDSVYAYISTFFKLDKWEYVKHKKGICPFQSAVTLWEQGLVPSFDGKTWRLHGGKDAKILFEISRTKLNKKSDEI